MVSFKGRHVFIYCLCSWIYVEAADLEYIESSIKHYFSDTRHHVINNDFKMASRDYIYRQFSSFGLVAEYFEFSLPPVSTKSNFTTVIGMLKGSHFGTAYDKMIAIGAHYDTVNTTKGVDDNGSGVVAMLEVARQITTMNRKGTKRKNTIMFAAFDLKEQNCKGSELLLASWLEPWLVKNYGQAAESLESHGVFILDSVMAYNASIKSQTNLPNMKSLFPETFSSVSKDNYKGDFLAMVYRNPTSDLVLANMFKAKWKEANREHFELESFPLPFEEYSKLPEKQQLNYRYFMNSDHASFWDYEVPAIYLTDTFIYRGVMTTCYHKPCDDVSVLLTDDNLKFLGKTADVLTMTINQLSDPFQGTNGASRCNQQTLWIILIYIISKNMVQFL
ncbi:uncharacterized protein LOC127700504 isoform X4 [Mytilus californianus]|uniref:uncharacterized protein LOC127700504 isoform X4 n=1 Tax=Mytilus californianus TaxID=6549 RepID=UPI00224699B1|nr:uncharacterized protein LOC127700504 isoform X4 [Mytilus californianus]